MNSEEPVTVQCPCCGEWIDILVDCSLPEQSYIEDCQVCCRPINVNVKIDAMGMPDVLVRDENDTG